MSVSEGTTGAILPQPCLPQGPQPGPSILNFNPLASGRGPPETLRFYPRTCRLVRSLRPQNSAQPLGPRPDFQPRSQLSVNPSLSGSSLSCASTRLPSPRGPIKLSAEVPPPPEGPRRAAANHPLPGSAERSQDPDLWVPFPQPLTSRRSRAAPSGGAAAGNRKLATSACLRPAARALSAGLWPLVLRVRGSGAQLGAFCGLRFHPNSYQQGHFLLSAQSSHSFPQWAGFSLRSLALFLPEHVFFQGGMVGASHRNSVPIKNPLVTRTPPP